MHASRHDQTLNTLARRCAVHDLQCAGGRGGNREIGGRGAGFKTAPGHAWLVRQGSELAFFILLRSISLLFRGGQLRLHRPPQHHHTVVSAKKTSAHVVEAMYSCSLARSTQKRPTNSPKKKRLEEAKQKCFDDGRGDARFFIDFLALSHTHTSDTRRGAFFFREGRKNGNKSCKKDNDRGIH